MDASYPGEDNLHFDFFRGGSTPKFGAADVLIDLVVPFTCVNRNRPEWVPRRSIADCACQYSCFRPKTYDHISRFCAERKSEPAGTGWSMKNEKPLSRYLLLINRDTYHVPNSSCSLD